MNSKFLSILALVLLLIAGGIAWLNRPKDASPEVTQQTEQTPPAHSSARDDSSRSSITNPYGETREQREERETQGEIERDRMTAMWQQNASLAFAKTRDQLAADLHLSAEQSEQVKAIFAQRQQELAKLLGIMTSGGTTDEMEVFRRITALIRNKGLRADLEKVLSAEQLKSYDEAEAKRDREIHEARAYRDMAEINEVLQLTDTQKQQLLGVLTEQATAKVEKEADSRAFMSLMYGGLAADMDSSNVLGLANMLDTNSTGQPNLEYGSAEHMKWIEKEKTERIDHELSTLKNVLTEDQLARYREHLEEQPLR